MRRFKPVRWIPDASTERPHQLGAELAVVYCYSARDRLCAVAYIGKRAKPEWHYSYKSEEQREARIQDLFESVTAWQARKAAQRAAARQPHGLQVGDILHTSWGYEQTNIEYFEVVGVRGAVVDLREIAQERTETGFMQYRAKPIPGHYIGPVRKGKRPRVYSDCGRISVAVRIDDCRTAWPGGQELSGSSYA